MFLLKPGVRVTGLRPEILLAVIAAERVYEEAGHDLTITVQKVIARIKTCLADDFDVLLEVDHIHIEFQPKQALTNG
jgi:hypothetical protein